MVNMDNGQTRMSFIFLIPQFFSIHISFSMIRIAFSEVTRYVNMSCFICTTNTSQNLMHIRIIWGFCKISNSDSADL